MKTLVVLCLLSSLTAQSPLGSTPAISVAITTHAPNTSYKYTVAHTSDLHLWYYGPGYRETWVDNEFDRFALLDSIQPLRLILNSGDNAGGLGANQAAINKFVNLRDDPLRGFLMPPWISAMGNHEIDGDPTIGKSSWLTALHPGVQHGIPTPGNTSEVYYATLVGEFVYVVLDQNALGCGGYCFNSQVSQVQLTWLQSVFSHPLASGKTGVIVMHEPLLLPSGVPTNSVSWFNAHSQTVMKVFTGIPQIKVVLTGHVHTKDVFKAFGIVWVAGNTDGQSNYFLEINERAKVTFEVARIYNSGSITHPVIPDFGYIHPF